jgi:hypothetical protein
MEFSKIDLSSEPVLLTYVCRECAKQGIYHEPTDSFFAHCEHRLNGAYRVSGGQWKKMRGIESANFKQVIIRACTVAELKVDVARGLAGIVQDEANNSTRH